MYDACMGNKSVACLGNGFVGGSLTTCLSERGLDVYVYDKAGKVAEGGIDALSKFGTHDVSNDGIIFSEETPIQRIVKKCENVTGFTKIYFVCLPTPMFEDGECDTSIVEKVLSELASVPGDRIAVVKSTVPPGSTEKWNKKFEGTGLHIVFNPEFLREVSALDDMRNQNRIILGGPRPHINKVKQLFQSAFPNVPIIKTSSTTAEMVKYTINNFLATKVSFANEMCQICEALDAVGLNIDYDKVIEYACKDDRLGPSHWMAPGPDGLRGYSGSCFPKDINAMIHVAKSLGVDPKMLSAAWSKNLDVRPEKDWEKLLGRAVSTKNK